MEPLRPGLSANTRASGDADLTGRVRRGYAFETCVAHTALSQVYRARELTLDRPVAVKVSLSAHAGRPAALSRFAAEARRLAQLDHPHIVPLYGAWQDQTGVYLVLRWMAGGSLERALATGPLPLPAVAHLFAQLADGLVYAHRQGVIHCDLKPGNMLLDGSGNVALADFGIAQQWGHGPATGYSARYAPPEQRLGAPATPQTDIYSLAAVLLELLSGKRFVAGSPLPSALSTPFADAIARALDHDAARRHLDVASFAAEIAAAFAAEGIYIHTNRQLVALEVGTDSASAWGDDLPTRLLGRGAA